MTQARSQLVSTDAPGTYHCVQRCVRRAFLCGVDAYSGQDFEHRKPWIEQRLSLVAECFAAAIHAYAVMSNHLHVVVHVDPEEALLWTDIEVAERWVRLFPPREPTDVAHTLKVERLLVDPGRLAVLRRRLGNLSWLMKCLVEPIARRANAEDGCKGRFWEGRFKAQRLCDERAVLAAMMYVDLNPVRAGMASRLETSRHTSVAVRLQSSPDALAAPLAPVVGALAMCLPIRTGDYLELVAWTGQQIHPGKRGRLSQDVPEILKHWEASPARWRTRVLAIGSGYWRVVGEAQDLKTWAERIGQRWLKGLRLATTLAQPR
ncbi:MAG: hypothetical protein ABL934_11105 [Lysobacteraceae bacterium]